MNFTRDPMIETIITPKEGFKLVIRNSKGGGQEEFVVDSVQVVLVGQNCFYRSLEKPKAFLVPAQDYEVLEVREQRIVMKLPGGEKGGIKIGGGREGDRREHDRQPKPPREPREEPREEEDVVPEEGEPRSERRKERKRFRRGRRFEKEGGEEQATPSSDEIPLPPREDKPTMIIPPPSTLISETIARYKDIPGFASAFFEKKEEEITAPEISSSEENRTEES